VRAGELGVKRDAVEAGLALLLRVGLADVTASADGVQFQAGDGAHHFVDILGSSYASTLHERVTWVLRQFEDLSENTLRLQMRSILDSWSQEFQALTTQHEEIERW
jgi:hypothetical protein